MQEGLSVVELVYGQMSDRRYCIGAMCVCIDMVFVIDGVEGDVVYNASGF
jgi:hypothetical protein